MYTHILISTDGSALAQRGVDHGLSLANALGSKVTIITVTEPLPVKGVKLTVTPPMPLPTTSVTRTTIGCASVTPPGALWPPPLTRTSATAGPGVIVKAGPVTLVSPVLLATRV